MAYRLEFSPETSVDRRVAGTATETPGIGASSAEPNDAVLTVMRSRLQELQHAVAARDEFIATVAHELRNPVSPLIFQLRLAIEKTERIVTAGEPIPVEWVQSQLRRIEQHLHRLLETLDRLLDVSRLCDAVELICSWSRSTSRETVREVLGTFDAELAVARCRLVFAERGDATGRVGSRAAGADLPQPGVECDSVRRRPPDRSVGRSADRGFCRRSRCGIMASALRRRSTRESSKGSSGDSSSEVAASGSGCGWSRMSASLWAVPSRWKASLATARASP